VVGDDVAVPVRVHRPRDLRAPAGCIVSFHGGGYVAGSYDSDDIVFDRWCPKLGAVGVSVQYRLAPEVPYPGPLEDCYQALRWVRDNADELGVDPDMVGVHGVSAGGGLAAALALLVRERGDAPLRFQALDCPMLDDRQQTGTSQLDGLHVWSRESNEFGWRSYLGDLYGSAHVPSTAAPAREVDLSGLPPAFVSVGSIDGFRDEDVDYAMRLMDAGVPTELHVYPGAPHGYHLAPRSAIFRQARLDLFGWLERQLHR